MNVDEEFRSIMYVAGDIYPSRSKLDVALAKLGIYMKFLASHHKDLIDKHPVILKEFFNDEYKGMTPEQMRCFFRACPSLRDARLQSYLDDLWEYFKQNDAFDTETIENIEEARRQKGDRWLSKGLLNKHLSRMVDPEKDAILSKSMVDGKSRYTIKFTRDIMSLRIPFDIKKAIAETSVSNIFCDCDSSIKAFLFNCSSPSQINSGPLIQKQIDFEKEIRRMSARFSQEIIDLYLRTFLPDKSEAELMKELKDIQLKGLGTNNEKRRGDLEKKNKRLLSPLPIILIAPLGEKQLHNFLPPDN